MEFTQDEIRQQYDEEAFSYDFKIAIIERLTGIASLRRALLQKATGNVLEIAIGTGRTLPHYPQDCAVTGIDISPQMLRVARARAQKLHVDAELLEMDAQHLTFPDRMFDTVVMSLSLCTIPDPVKSLQEMKRVCKPDGKALLIQHGRSNVRWLARLQDRYADAWYKHHLGCRWNYRHEELVARAGWEIRSARKAFFGVVYAIEAIPSHAAPSPRHV